MSCPVPWRTPVVNVVVDVNARTTRRASGRAGGRTAHPVRPRRARCTPEITRHPAHEEGVGAPTGPPPRGRRTTSVSLTGYQGCARSRSRGLRANASGPFPGLGNGPCERFAQAVRSGRSDAAATRAAACVTAREAPRRAPSGATCTAPLDAVRRAQTATCVASCAAHLTAPLCIAPLCIAPQCTASRATDGPAPCTASRGTTSRGAVVAGACALRTRRVGGTRRATRLVGGPPLRTIERAVAVRVEPRQGLRTVRGAALVACGLAGRVRRGALGVVEPAVPVRVELLELRTVTLRARRRVAGAGGRRGSAEGRRAEQEGQAPSRPVLASHRELSSSSGRQVVRSPGRRRGRLRVRAAA